MQRALGDHWDVWLFDVFAADAREHFAVYRQLTVGAVIRGCPDVNETAHNSEQQDSQRTGENRDFQLRRHGFIFREETGTSLQLPLNYNGLMPGSGAKFPRKQSAVRVRRTSRLLEVTSRGSL